MHDHPILTSAVVRDEGVALSWSDGASARRHALWLRDVCPCAVCEDPLSSQRNHDAADLPPDLAVRHVAVGNDGALTVTWDPDGHVSRYDAAWLGTHLRGPVRAAPRLWGRDLEGRVPRAVWGAVSTDKAALRRWLADLRDVGITVLEGTPSADSQVERVAELYGYVHEGNDGRHFEVRSQAQAINFAYTPKTLAVHTDRPFADPVPGVQRLHCLVQGEDGGENILVDGFAVAEGSRRAEPAAFAALARIPAEFRNRHGTVDLLARRPVIRLGADGGIEAIHVNDRCMRPPETDDADIAAFYGAYRAFVARLRAPEACITVKLRAGDTPVFDNRRVLHGRAGYDATRAHRHLQGTYTDWCYVESTLRRIDAELGPEPVAVQ